MYPICCIVRNDTLFLPFLAQTPGHSSYKRCCSPLTAHIIITPSTWTNFCIAPSTLTKLLHCTIHHIILQQWQMHLSLLLWLLIYHYFRDLHYCHKSELFWVMEAVAKSHTKSIQRVCINWRKSNLLSIKSMHLSPLVILIAVPVCRWEFPTFTNGTGRRWSIESLVFKKTMSSCRTTWHAPAVKFTMAVKAFSQQLNPSWRLISLIFARRTFN